MDLKQEFDGSQNIQQEEEQEHFHVLAVDDSLIDRKLLEKLLTVSSYKVTCVDSGDKALEYLGLLENNDSTSTCSSSSSCSCLPSSSQLQEVQGSKVNLIMTDYSMPGMSGYDLLKRVKGSTWKDVPVVVMSSENVPSRINMCLEGGAEEFLLKPVKLSDLRKLQSYLLNDSLSNPCKMIIDNEFVDQNHDNTINDHDIINNSTNDKSGTNNANKRKAMSPDRIERRPKMKELVVL